MLKEIFAYTNYREWLNDFCEDRKRSKSGFSYRLFSLRSGFSSPNFLRMVVQGKRNLSPDAVAKISKFAGLSKNESNFLFQLVLFNQGTHIEEKGKYFEKLCYFKAFREIRKIDTEQYAYFSHWSYPVIREMANVEGFRPDPNWITKLLGGRITTDEAMKALEVLQSLGFLKPDAFNRLRPAAPALSTDSEVTNVAIWNFHRNMIEEAKTSLERTPAAFRDVSSVTIAIDKPTLDNLKKKLQDLRQELLVAMSRTKKPEVVYQLNFQLFNLTSIPTTWAPKAKK